MSPSICQLKDPSRETPAKDTTFILHLKGAEQLEKQLKEHGRMAEQGLKKGEGLVYPGYKNLDHKEKL